MANTLPEFFTHALNADYSEGDVKRILEGLSCARKTTLRANSLKSSAKEIESALTQASISFAKVPWYSDAFILEDGKSKEIRETNIYEEGKIYLQSLSSMLPPLELKPKPGQDILDMCAAPGSKTTQLAALGGKGCNITACEMHAPRAEKLQYNLNKQGATNVTVMRTDARQLDEFFRFDKILLDAPCSGSGTINVNDQKLGERFTQKLVYKCKKSQSALLGKALTLMKPGSILLYSTCSILKAENEEIVNSALAKASQVKHQKREYEIVPIELPEDIPTLPSTIEGAATVCPTNLYEGFFMCKIKQLSA